MLVKFSIGAGKLVEFSEKADFFRLMNTEGEVTVYFYSAGREIAKAEGVAGGYAEKFGEAFDRVAIYSAVAQEVQIVCRYGNVVSYDQPPQGLVIVSNWQGEFSQAAKSASMVSAELLPAKVGRRYLLIQNKDAAQDIFVTVDGTAATTSKGIKIAPGGSLEFANFCPVGAINARAASATNNSIIVVEG